MRRPDAATLGLIAYGAGALVLLLATLFVVLAALAAVERASASLDAASGPALERRLDRLASSLEETEKVIRGFDETLAATSDAARDGRMLGTGLASSLRRLATSMDVAVLGTRPFAEVGAEFAGVADRADALAGDLGRTASSLDGNRASLDSLAEEVAGIHADLGELRAELGAGDGANDADAGGTSGLLASTDLALARVVSVAFLAWLAIPAALAIALGHRRWRSVRR